MVEVIRDVESVLGSGIKRPTKNEKERKKAGRRSIVARVNIPQGAIITEEMLDVKRPGTGIEPKYLDKVIGRKAKEKIRPDELVTFAKLL